MSEPVTGAPPPDDDDVLEERDERGSPLTRVLLTLTHFGRRHRTTFFKGCVGALFMVAARIAMPWPAHALMHYWKLGETAAETGASVDPGSFDRSVMLGLAFLGLLAALGLADAIVRVQFARFSIGTMRDVRAAGIAAALLATGRQGDPGNLPVESGARNAPDAPPARRIKSGDLVARLVGDTARVKAGMKGFLVHVVPNSLLYIGVTVVLYWINFKLGLIFGAAGLGMAAVTIVGARSMYRKSKKYRKKEGKLADHIDRALQGGRLREGFADANRSSGRHEAALTYIQSLVTWTTYILFGLAVLATVWIGTREIAAGALEARDMVLFLMYALILRGSTVRLARQGSRLGKTFGSARRILKVLESQPACTLVKPSVTLPLETPAQECPTS